MRTCAFLTTDDLEDFVVYDHYLYDPLRKRGWKVDEVSWKDPEPRWEQYEVVLIRTPWDYQDDPDAFLEVLREIDASPARLENSLELVEWNIDKRYLRDMEQRGIPVVPTLWPDRFDEDAPERWLSKLEVDEIIIKPVVGANADHTYRLKRSIDSAELERIRTVFSGRDFLVQPFMTNIVSEGEFSLFYFGRQYSHSILKTPKPGDFRVQEEHGGRLKTLNPEKALREAGDRALDSLDPLPLYSRIDFVRTAGGAFLLMELELIEPSLYFNMDPGSAERFARVFDEWMS